jgi:hypothetical protein
MTPFGEGVWLATEPVRIVGMRLSATMTLVRLGDGSLLAYSPVALTAERRAAVAALGRVAHLYAPSAYHDRWIGEWADAFPEARVHAPAALGKKRKALRVDRALGTAPEPAFAGVVDEVHIDGFRLDETVLVHRPSRTLVVADLVHNVGRPEGGWARFYTRAMGFYDRVALSRNDPLGRLLRPRRGAPQPRRSARADVRSARRRAWRAARDGRQRGARRGVRVVVVGDYFRSER